jgi:hypothetical protein
MKNKLNINMEDAAELIGVPLDKWAGNCSTIAHLFVQTGLVKGQHQYGHYLGEIHPDAQCFGGRVFTHHAWILTPDNQIVDPTRWVFESADPYVYIGPNDPDEYDFGGNRIYEIYNLKPPPVYDPNQPQFAAPKRVSLHFLLARLLDFPDLNDNLSQHQLFWLANLPPKYMDGYEKQIYEYIVDEVKIPVLIPFDNRMQVLGR